MTLLISWIGVDSRAVSSIYLASDSRYSWGNAKYDSGVKLFGSIMTPDIFGFCGDVTFSSNLLNQIISQINTGLLITNTDTGESKNEKILEYIRNSLSIYPTSKINHSFTILHCTRNNKKFQCFQTFFSEKKGLLNEEVKLPEVSQIIYSGGSGKLDFDRNWRLWDVEKHNDYRTSRGVYHCFVKTLRNTNDIFVGGVPQIIGLYRNGNAKIFGIIENNKKYIYGQETSNHTDFNKIQWRNHNFERMNPETLKILDGAQAQPS